MYPNLRDYFDFIGLDKLVDKALTFEILKSCFTTSQWTFYRVSHGDNYTVIAGNLS